MPHFQESLATYKSFQSQRCPQDSDSLLSPSVTKTIYPQGFGHFSHGMHYQKGDGDQDLCHDSSVCGEKGWTWQGSSGCCHKIPVGTTDLPPCHTSGSISRDIEGSCQSAPQSCHPVEPCPPRSCFPPQQSRDSNKPWRRVEVNHVQPTCPPPVKIHRRPLQQYRPPLCSEEPGCCGKPRQRVEQCPTQEICPPVIVHPRPLQHHCIPCHCPPVRHHCSCVPCHRLPVQHRCPAPVPLPLQPSQHQQKQIPLLPPCLQKK